MVSNALPAAGDTLEARTRGRFPDLKPVAPISELLLVQLAPGPMTTEAVTLSNRRTSVTRLDMLAKARGHVVLSPDHMGLIVPISYREHVIDGAAFQADNFYESCSPDGYQTLGQDRHFFGITMHRASFSETLAALRGVCPGEVASASRMHLLPAGGGRRLAADLALAMDADGTGSPDETDAKPLAEIENLVLDAYLAATPEHSAGAVTRRSKVRAVRKAEEIFQDQTLGSVSLADLCAITGLSSSALYRAFAEIVGVPPLRYFRMRRLNRVHDVLRDQSHRRGGVTWAATSSGFTELGRFARDYRLLFGETPSQTLRRHRNSALRQ